MPKPACAQPGDKVYTVAWGLGESGGQGMVETTEKMTMARGTRGHDQRLSIRPRWEPVVRGLAVLAIGVVAFLHPDLTHDRFLTLFGTLVFIEGIFHMVGGFSVKASNPQWALMLVGGAFSLCLGMFILGWGRECELDLLVFVAYWAIILGTVHAVFAARAGIDGKMGLLFGAGLVSIAFGLYALLQWDGTAIDMVNEIAFVTVVIGLLLVVLGGRSGGPEW